MNYLASYPWWVHVIYVTLLGVTATVLLYSAAVMVIEALRWTFQRPDVELMRSVWRDPALLSDDDPRRF